MPNPADPTSKITILLRSVIVDFYETCSDYKKVQAFKIRVEKDKERLE
jgi:hypothetical protein